MDFVYALSREEFSAIVISCMLIAAGLMLILFRKTAAEFVSMFIGFFGMGFILAAAAVAYHSGPPLSIVMTFVSSGTMAMLEKTNEIVYPFLNTAIKKTITTFAEVYFFK